MATNFSNLIRAFYNFIKAFLARWWVAVTFLSGVPLMFGSYFVPGGSAGFILPLAGICCMVFASFLVWKAENDARLKAEALVYHPFIDIERSYIFPDPPKY